jgi:hypothetical protein
MRGDHLDNQPNRLRVSQYWYSIIRNRILSVAAGIGAIAIEQPR